MPRLRATYGEALLRAHRALLKGLNKLREAASAEKAADLAAQLDVVRADIQRHFDFEEKNGYMASVLLLHPHLERTVERLHGEHAQLLRELDELSAQACSAPAVGAELRAKVLGFLNDVRRHERSENVLVQDAFSLDIDAED